MTQAQHRIHEPVGRQDRGAWLVEHQAARSALDEDELRALAADTGVSYVGPILPSSLSTVSASWRRTSARNESLRRTVA
jgi:hypothetical protein